MLVFAISVALLLPGGCAESRHQVSNNDTLDRRADASLSRAMAAVQPFFRTMGKPGPFDWLASHKEKGQTFEEYLDEEPYVPAVGSQTIYILPLGKFTQRQKKIFDAASDYISAFYGLPVRKLPEQPLKEPLRTEDFRRRTKTRYRQVRAGFILDEVLRPAIPSDAAALVAFTSEDLFPDSSMNYVFGLASFEHRVGVWSLFRLDDNAAARTFLLRTLKIAVHETGHIFGMKHCTKYECVMSGTNYLGETDSRPIDACPECMAKVCWMTRSDPAGRYVRLADFCRRNGLADEEKEFTRKAEAVRQGRQAF